MMSQICPSPSHQLVAAAIAFQRARLKFPKNYGLCANLEQRKPIKDNRVGMSEDLNDQNSVVSSTKCISPDTKSSQIRAVIACNDEREESAFTKENSFEKPIMCSCCRKRNEAAQLNEPIELLKPRKPCNAGDTIDFPSTGEYKYEIAKNSGKNDAYKTHHRGKQNRKSWRSDSVHFLYGRFPERITSNQNCCPLDEQNREVEGYKHNFREKYYKKEDHRNPRSMFDSLVSRRNDNLTPDTPCTCDFHSVKHSSLDLLRPHQNHRRQHRLPHCQGCCHHRFSHWECNSYSSKERPFLTSDTCLCFGSCNNNCQRNHSIRTQNDIRKISSVREQNDDDYEDPVAVINHKDSLCILVEKYKARKKCKRKSVNDCKPAINVAYERNQDECNKSLTSEINCQPDTNENVLDVEHREKSSVNDFSRRRRNCVSSIDKTCGHTHIFQKTDCNQLKDLKSRFATGTCCQTKATMWRHTF